MSNRIVRVAEFTRTPGARYRTDGQYSGQEFREDILAPAFDVARASNEKLLVDLDGTHGYATSFLEETFGGLARIHGSTVVLSHLSFKTNDEPRLLTEILGYINNPNGQ